MIKSTHTLTRAAYRHTSIRYASVLASIPRQPPVHWTAPIVTPAEEPITIPSNNAFHPDVIPAKAKARINLQSISNMLDVAQRLVRELQVQHQPGQAHLVEQVQAIVKEQKKLMKLLESPKKE
ncbi:hypothetical protein INT43_006325 [Umbelopsis isabellina]|uniref:Uncharacterized protein n=1 Tax=Mortierella isabellina TaxID=91625 RepID=A0A8H7UHJ7_MORIS|nr:hypothetical protein INT43_006325 [Umbelopsis isabellina]